ncbi:MAG: hypothetical protein H8E48_02600 [Chloroflexi bacterium]|nr:hypothetical protein [Chloroflexota bacterium]
MKNFLKHNQIYFETLLPGLAAFASFVAIFVAAISIIIALDARDLSEAQNKVTENINRPFITPVERAIYDDNLGVVEARIELINHGEIARNIEMDYVQFIETQCLKNLEGERSISTPIFGYYRQASTTGDPVGVIARLNPFDNFFAMGELYRQVILLNDFDVGSAYPSFESIIELRYETTSGQFVQEFFRATPHGFSGPLERDSAESKISRYYDSPLLDFNELAAKQVYDWCEFSQK